ncbi:hypothetical protein ACTXT7_011668 [Hymenolepis weldensis]
MSKIPSSISKSPSSNTYWAVAILNYKPKDYDELCLTNGQAIQVLSVDPQVSGSTGWWVGQDCNGNVGVFPANYVQLQESPPNAIDLRNSSGELSSSFQECNTSSFFMDSTLVGTHAVGQSAATDSSLGTGIESDGDLRTRQQTKFESLSGALSHLRLIKFEDIILGELHPLRSPADEVLIMGKGSELTEHRNSVKCQEEVGIEVRASRNSLELDVTTPNNISVGVCPSVAQRSAYTPEKLSKLYGNYQKRMSNGIQLKT